MAKYGLQTPFLNEILIRYFGNGNPNIDMNELYVGLGATQTGADINMETFNELFDGKPLCNYQRARIIFNTPENGVISNADEVCFNTASEDWTTATSKVEMLGIFRSADFDDKDPIVVISLPKPETVSKGETILLAKGVVQLSLTDI